MSLAHTTRHWIVGIVAAAGIVAATPTAAQVHAGGEHGHGHEGHASERAGLELNQGRKWATDAPLRTGMAAIRTLVTDAGEHAGPAQAATLAEGVRGQVNYLIANCKLEPKADAVLHVLIGRMLSGAGSLSEPATAEQGLATLREALQLYPQYFEHPGWK